MKFSSSMSSVKTLKRVLTNKDIINEDKEGSNQEIKNVKLKMAVKKDK